MSSFFSQALLPIITRPTQPRPPPPDQPSLPRPDTPPHPTPELSPMSVTDRSGDHEDPLNYSLLAAMDPGPSSEDEKMVPLTLPVKLRKMKI